MSIKTLDPTKINVIVNRHVNQLLIDSCEDNVLTIEIKTALQPCHNIDVMSLTPSQRAKIKKYFEVPLSVLWDLQFCLDNGFLCSF